MVTVDTTVIVRLLANDDPRLAKRAAALLASKSVCVPVTVLLESEWVLRHAYKLDTPSIANALRSLLGLRNVTVSQPQETQRALQLYEQGLDFADALHLATTNGASDFKTFDAQLCRRARQAGLRRVSMA